MVARSHHADIETDMIRRVEAITGPVRRRRWTAEEKARIVAESFAGRLSVSDVARRQGVAGGLLFAWRKQARDGALAIALPEDSFIPLAVDDGGSSPVAPPGVIEVAAGGLVVRVPASADEEMLRRVRNHCPVAHGNRYRPYRAGLTPAPERMASRRS